MLHREKEDPKDIWYEFQWAPTLGGECYSLIGWLEGNRLVDGFNGHPPLGVNATRLLRPARIELDALVSMGTHPSG